MYTTSPQKGTQVDNENIQLNPQTVINELQNRLNALQSENVVLAAMITELRSSLEGPEAEETAKDAEEVQAESD